MHSQTSVRIPDSHTHSMKLRDLGGNSLEYKTWNQDRKNCLVDLGTPQVYTARVSTVFRDMKSFCNKTLLQDYTRSTTVVY